MTFTHIVTFQWRTDIAVHRDEIAAVAEALRGLAARLDGVEDYRCGSDAGLSPGAYDFAVVGTFENRESFIGYRDHPEHQRILNEMILPILGDRTVVQLED